MCTASDNLNAGDQSAENERDRRGLVVRSYFCRDGL